MKRDITREDGVILLCRLLVCFTFLGRAWQHLRWDAPLRVILWRQKLLEPVVNLFDVSWREWVTSPAVDAGINHTGHLIGLFYLFCAIAAFRVTSNRAGLQRLLAAGGAMLCFLGFLYFLDKGMRWGQWAEYSLQFSGPFFLIAVIRGKAGSKTLHFALKAAIALTFIGHGLYAVGYYPQPGNFVTMIMNGMHVSEDMARGLLKGAGYIDFVIAALLFAPVVWRPACYYMVFWGFATALARIVSYYDPINWVGWLDGWMHQCLYRLIHGGMPLVLLLCKGALGSPLFRESQVPDRTRDMATT